MSRRSTVLASLVTSTLLTLVTAAPAHAATGYADTAYVALGDSYSSGVGAPGQSGLCLRGSSGYPAQWARNNKPATYSNVACLGATTDDVLLWQVPYLSKKTDLVTITIGGNDVGFAPVVITCTVGTYDACADAVQTAHDYTHDKMAAKLDKTYAAIRKAAPNAKVVVLGYPILFDTASADCGIGGMTLPRRQIINAGNEDLDNLIRDRAKAAGFTFADVRDNFDRHRICSAVPWLNGLTVIPPSNSFHPNQTGYTYGYLAALTSALG
jgi:lysophospholipase L1-like esterase